MSALAPKQNVLAPKVKVPLRPIDRLRREPPAVDPRPRGGRASQDPPVQLPNAPARPSLGDLLRRRTAGGAPWPAGNPLAALRHRDFRLFYLGQTLSLIGTWMQSTAQGWLVLELTDSELLLGLVTAAGSAPILLLTLYAGVLADRHDKRRIILAAQVAVLTLALALAVLTDTGRITIHWILAIVFLVGVANAFEVPARQSWFVELVGKRDLTNAIALNSSAFNLTRVVGPALAGMLIGAAGIASCFYLNSLSYLAVIAGLLAIRRPQPRRPAPREGIAENLREGFRYIATDRVAGALVGLVAAASILAFPYSMLLPVFARDILHVGAQGLGWLLSATGLGALVGSVMLATIAGRVARGPLMLSSAAAFSLMLVGFALSRSLTLSLVLLAGAGFTMIPFTASVNALLQSRVPDRLRGRVMSVYVFMFLGMGPVGSLQAGALARWLGAPAAIAAGAGALLAVVACIAAGVRELREVR